MTDFPRGWVMIATAGSQVGCTLVIPAVPAVARVVDTIYFQIISYATTAVTANLNITSSDGAINIQSLMELAATVSSATEYIKDSDTATGLDIATGPNASITITSAGIQAVSQLIRVQGHDI